MRNLFQAPARWLARLLGLVLIASALVFAIYNRHEVAFELSVMRWDLPLYVIGIALFALGFLCGGLYHALWRAGSSTPRKKQSAQRKSRDPISDSQAALPKPASPSGS